MQTTITMYVDAKVGERRQVWRIKRVQGTVGAFDCPIASVELVVEKDAHFWYAIGSSNDQSTEKVIPPIAPYFKNGNLRPGDYHRFAQVLQHERQRRSRVGQRISAVEDDEAVKEFVRSLQNQARSHQTLVCNRFNDGRKLNAPSDLWRY